MNQAVFPNFTVTDGWIYLGSYDFSGSGTEFVRLTNKTLDEPVSAPGLELGADAMRFAPLMTGPTFTPTIPSHHRDDHADTLKTRPPLENTHPQQRPPRRR